MLFDIDPGETPRALVLHANAVALILTLLIPVAVALITKRVAATWIKQVATIVLSGAVTLLTNSQLPDGTAVLGLQTMFDWTVTTAIAVVSYLGFWSSTVQVNERAAPGVGIG